MSIELDLLLILIIICVISAVIYFIYKWWTKNSLPPATKKTGQSCSNSTECLNGFCGSISNSPYDKSNTVCCPSGAGVIDKTTGLTYCTEVPDGNSCYDDYTCSGGNCQGSPNGVCYGSPSQEPCTTNSGCGLNACAYASYEDYLNGASYSCCKSGSYSIYETGNGTLWPFCNDMPVGNTCYQNGMCKNGACGLQNYAAGANYICCPSGNTELNAGFTYCTDIPNGQACKSNAMCASQFCGDDYLCHERTS